MQAADAPALARFAKIGFEPCKPFALAKLDPASQAALKNLPKAALDKIGANKYRLTFPKGQTPPVNGFWSITLYFQKDSPGKDKESNWLPAPDGEFIPMLRMYWPTEKTPSILNGTWRIPTVQKAQ